MGCTEPSATDGAPATSGQVLDMYLLATGEHVVEATATDLVGNTGVATRPFTLLATAISLRANIDRALAEGSITDPAVYTGLRDKLDTAVRSHQRGKHAVEEQQLAAVVEQLAAQSGKGIDADLADRMTGWIVDLMTAE